MIVVDASVAVKWILPEEHTEQARDLLDASVRAGDTMIAPPLLVSEVTNVLRKRLRAVPPLARDEALDLLAVFLAYPYHLDSPDGMYERALGIADEFKLRAVYDAHYLALGQLYDCEVWTADLKLIGAVSDRLPFIRWIGDYGASPAR